MALSQLEQEVVAAIKQANINLAEKQKNVLTIKEDGETSQTQKANGDSQMEQITGDLMAEVTKIMVTKYGAGIMSQLESIDIEAVMAAVNGRARKKRYSNEPTSEAGGCGKDSTDCSSDTK